MNVAAIRLTLILTALCAGPVAAEDHSKAKRHQVEQLMDEMVLAANAHDTDRFMAVYANTPSLVVTFDDMTMRGWKKVRDQQLEWWNGGTSDAVYRMRSAPQITPISPDVIATLQSMDVTSTGPDGKKGSVQVVSTSVWHKLPEGWRIVVAHESLIR